MTNTDPERLPNVHPGDVLREDYLKPLDLTPYRLAKGIGVSQTRVEEILDGKRRITLDTAMRLARFFASTPQFWLNLQMAYDLEELQRGDLSAYDQIQRYEPKAAA